MELAVAAFEQLARERVQLGTRNFASFDGLIHPVHRRGGVFVWEVRREDAYRLQNERREAYASYISEVDERAPF